MALSPILSAFQWGAGGAKLTPEEIAMQRAMLAKRRMNGVDTSPVAHWTQGAARIADAFGDVMQERRLNTSAADNAKLNEGILASLLGGSSPVASSPVASALSSGVNQELTATSPAIDVGPGGETYTPFIETVRAGGITNPFGLAAVASTGKAESGWSASNANRSWSDPSESGQAGTAGGILSWRGPRLAALQSYAKEKGESGNGSPATQAEFFLREDPKLVASLNSAKSVEEAQSAINRAWAFAGYNRPGGESARRLGYAKSYISQFQGGQPSGAAAAIEAQAPASAYVDPVVSAPNYSPSQAVSSALIADESFDGGRFGGAAEAPVIYSQPSDFASALVPPAPMRQAQTVAPIVASPQMAQNIAPTNSLGVSPAVLQALTSPYSTEQTRSVATLLLQQQTQQRQAAQEQQTWMQRQKYEQQLQANDPLRQAQIQKLQREAQNPNGDETFYGNPVPIQNPDGTVAYGQIGNRGTFKPISLGEGQSFAPPTRTIDAGTETVLVDQAGNVISRTPKQNRAAAAETAGGTVQGRTEAERQLSAPADYQSASNALSILDQIEKSPALEAATGMSSMLNAIPGTSGYDFQNIVEQAKSGAFLSAIESLRGMGALSNAEGGAATAAITRMDTATSTPAFKKALEDYRKIVNQGLERSKRNMPEGQRHPEQPASQAAPKRRRFNPATGELE